MDEIFAVPHLRESVALPSQIESVTVYRSGALVRRVAHLEPEHGTFPTAVRLENLPLCLDDAGVGIRIEALPEDRPPAVTASTWRVVLSVPPSSEAQDDGAALDDAIREARRRFRRFEDELRILQNEAKRLESLSPPPRPRGAHGEPPPPSPAGARLALFDFQHRELERLKDERADAEQSLRQAREDLQTLEDRRRRASTVRQAREHELRKAVVVPLQVDAEHRKDSATACRLVLEYPVPGARWSPGYVARLDGDSKEAELALRAVVSQGTGEDWSAVQLTLSTAEPQAWHELAELRSLRIGRRQAPPARTGWRPPPADTDALFSDYRRARSRKPASEAPPQPAIGENEASFLGVMPDTEPPETLFPEAEPPIQRAVAAGPPPAAALSKASMAKVASLGAANEAVRAARERGPMTRRRRSSPPSPPGRSLSESDPPTPPDAPRDLLDYGRLRLAGADEKNAGHLSRAPIHEDYLDLLVEMHVEVRWSLQGTFHKASRRARDLGDLPRGFAPIKSWKGFDHAYRSDQAVDVPSDGGYHHVPLLSRRAPCRLRYVVVPRETSQAFRVVAVDNPLDAPLPSGPVDVYVDGNYLLTSRIGHVAPGGRAELGLGVDEGVQVARNTHFEEQTTGLIRGRLGLEHRVEIELRHFHDRVLPFEVRERLPVKRDDDEDVEIEIVDVEPPWQAFKQEKKPVNGTYCWQVPVEPNETRHLSLRYVVRISPRHELVGGNRRES